jgi:hypothetical protein
MKLAKNTYQKRFYSNRGLAIIKRILKYLSRVYPLQYDGKPRLPGTFND